MMTKTHFIEKPEDTKSFSREHYANYGISEAAACHVLSADQYANAMLTDDPSKVTCERCWNTVLFKKATTRIGIKAVAAAVQYTGQNFTKRGSQQS